MHRQDRPGTARRAGPRRGPAAQDLQISTPSHLADFGVQAVRRVGDVDPRRREWWAAVEAKMPPSRPPTLGDSHAGRASTTRARPGLPGGRQGPLDDGDHGGGVGGALVVEPVDEEARGSVDPAVHATDEVSCTRSAWAWVVSSCWNRSTSRRSARARATRSAGARCRWSSKSRSYMGQNWPWAPAASAASAAARVRVDGRQREVAVHELDKVAQGSLHGVHDVMGGATERALRVPVLDKRDRCIHRAPDVVSVRRHRPGQRGSPYRH